MSVVETMFRTVTCNTCEKTVTYEVKDEQQTFNTPGNEWLLGLRTIQALDQRKFTYCSDICEVEGIKTGQHNMAQKKLIESAASPAQVAQAAAAAKAAEQATKALQGGRPVAGLTT